MAKSPALLAGRVDSVGLACAAVLAGGWAWDDLSEAQKDAWEFAVIRLVREHHTKETVGKILLEGLSDVSWHELASEDRARYTRAAVAVFRAVGEDLCV